MRKMERDTYTRAERSEAEKLHGGRAILVITSRAPRKLKLLRAEHAELSAVFLPGTIGRPPFPYDLLLSPRLSQVRASTLVLVAVAWLFFHEGVAPFNIVGGTPQV